MDLQEALSQVADIRQQMARAEIFRGYRAATTAFSGAVAILAGLVQSFFLPDPAHNPLPVIFLWTAAAALCLLVVGFEMALRIRRTDSPLQRQLTLLAIEQLTPAIVAGALLTYVIGAFLLSYALLLPGLWMILFALGVFASARPLPKLIFPVGGFYLLAGVVTLLLAPRLPVLSPWPMSLTFSIGQFAIAAILYTRLERPHA